MPLPGKFGLQVGRHLGVEDRGEVAASLDAVLHAVPGGRDIEQTTTAAGLHPREPLLGPPSLALLSNCAFGAARFRATWENISGSSLMAATWRLSASGRRGNGGGLLPVKGRVLSRDSVEAGFYF